MPPLFRRNSNIQCFFCQSPVSISKNARNFRCTSCGCWNRYDDKGEIISDEPAMHEEYLNSRSFAKRASPSKDQLPSIYGPGPFCHSCQTNQMLLVNLLSNYLPPPESAEYQARLQQLPAYKESLHLRYPPVCETCGPLVEEEIRKKDHMARVKALGGSLSRGVERRRKVSGPDVEREKSVSETIFWWKLRGCLWALSFVLSIIGTVSAALDMYPFRRLALVNPILPPLVVLSLLWTAWDPTYASFRKAQIQGRDVRIHGKRTYNTLQIIAWAFRLVSSIIITARWSKLSSVYFRLDGPILNGKLNSMYLYTASVIEFIALISFCFVPRLQHPPAIRLVDTSSHIFVSSRSATPSQGSRSSTPAVSKHSPLPEPDVLAALTLSSKPVITHTNPVFGLPSLQPSISVKPEPGEDEMDWTPTRADSSSSSAFGRNSGPSESDNAWLRPQRFFAPEKPTGLEGLFESTRLQDDAVVSNRNEAKGKFLGRFAIHLWQWRVVYISAMVVLLAVTFQIQRSGLATSAF